MNVRALAAAPFGFLIGVSLGAIGGGGSILAIPVLVFVAGQSPSAATTTSLIVVGAAALVGLAGHWRAGRVRVSEGIAFGAVGIGGALAGTWINKALNPDILLIAFSALTVVAAWRMKTACPGCTNAGTDQALKTPSKPAAATLHLDIRVTPKLALKVVVAGTVTGLLTGLFGVGGGFIIVPALTLVLGFTMAEAIGTSLLVIVVNVTIALALRAGTPVDWATTVPFALAAIAGVMWGIRIANRVPTERLLKVFAGLLVAVAAYTAARAAIALAA